MHNQPFQPEHIHDALLVLKAQAGEHGAVADLVRRWSPRLSAHARLLLGHDHGADDAVQETWLAVARGLHGLQDPEALAPWLFRTLRNKCIEHIRNAQRRRRAESPGAREPGAPPSHPVQEGQPDLAHLRDAIRSLPADDREVLSLHYASGLSTSQIGDALAMPQGTVKTRLARARAELKSILER